MNVIENSFEHRRPPVPPLDAVDAQEPLGVPVSRVFRVLRRRGWIAGLVVVVVMAGATAVVLQLEASFMSQASVLVEARRSQLSDLQVSAREVQDTPSAVQTQIDIMRSPALILQIVTSLQLTTVPEFNPPDNGLMARLRALLGVVPGQPTQAERELTAADILTGKLTFTSELRSSVVKVAIETTDAGRSAAIVNSLAEHYLAYNRDRKFATLQRAVSWFQTRLSELAVQVQSSQSAVQSYREANNLADTPMNVASAASERLSVQAQQLTDISRQLTEVSGERARREAQIAEVAERLRRQGRSPGLPEVPPNLLAEVNAIRTQEDTLRQAIAAARKAVADENAATSQMAGLLAQAQSSRVMYDSFLARSTQLANAEGVQDLDAELLSAGTVANGPSSPKRARLLGVAFGFALLLGLALALLAERMRSGLGNLMEVEARLGVRPLTVVPHLRLGRHGEMERTRHSLDFRNAMQRILGILTVAGKGEWQKVITITSALPQEGKSVLAYGLAESAAQAGLKVLLIDADLRRPTLQKRLRLSTRHGLSDVLKGGLRLEEAITQLSSGLHVLPAGNPGTDLQQLLASPQMRTMLQTARGSFDLVVIDTPPILPIMDALLVAQRSDAVILAARWEHTPAPLVQEAARLLHHSGVPLTGVVLTRAKLGTYANSASEGAAYVHKHFRRYYRLAA